MDQRQPHDYHKERGYCSLERPWHVGNGKGQKHLVESNGESAAEDGRDEAAGTVERLSCS